MGKGKSTRPSNKKKVNEKKSKKIQKIKSEA